MGLGSLQDDPALLLTAVELKNYTSADVANLGEEPLEEHRSR
jgi:hypothetical protein